MSFGFSRAIIVVVVSVFVDCFICNGGLGSGRAAAEPWGAAVAAGWLSLGILEDVDSVLISTAAAAAAVGAAVEATASTALRVGAMVSVCECSSVSILRLR